MKIQDQFLLDAQEAFEQNKMEEALQIITYQIVLESKEVLFLKGEILYKLERWGESQNTFVRILELFPQDPRATAYIKMIKNILDFYHKDLLNP